MLVSYVSDINSNICLHTHHLLQSSSSGTTEDVFSLLSTLLNKHLTQEQSERVLIEFRKVSKVLLEYFLLERLYIYTLLSFVSL